MLHYQVDGRVDLCRSLNYEGRAILRALTVLAVASMAGIVLTACGSEVAGDSVAATDTATPQSPSSASAESSEPRADAKPIPGRLQKDIGELAGIGCPTENSDDCDATFTVNSIERDTCDSLYAPLKADEQIIRFTGEVKGAAEFEYPAVGTFFLADNWSIEGADGFSTNGLDMAIGCDLDPGPLYNELAPGTKKRFDVAVLAPVDAEKLLLISSETSFEWEIAAD